MMRTTSRISRRRYEPIEDDDRPLSRRKKKRSRLGVLVFVAGLAALVWFLPAIVAFSPILSRLATNALADIRGTISIGQASLGWLSPVVVRDVHVRDSQGKPVATIPAVTSDKTLLGLLLDRRDLGKFKVERPELNLVLSEKSSNVEDVFGALIKPKDPASEPTGIGLSIVEGTAHIEDAVSGREWQIEGLSCDVDVPRAADAPVEVSAAGHVTPAQPTGRFSLHMKMQPGGPHPAAAIAADKPGAGLSGAALRPAWLDGSGDVTLAAESLPLELFEPLARRFAGTGELSGKLDASLMGEWKPDDKQQPRGEIAGQATLTNLVLVAPWLEDDRLHLASLHAPININRQGDRLEIRRCDIESDLGQLSCSGTIEDLGQLGPSWFASLWSVLPHTRGEIKGRVDLARLSRLLPTTMRVREGLQITEGSVQVDLTAGPQQDRWACAGRLETTRLVATEEGRQIVWEHPLLITASGHDSPQGLIIERLNGQADFLKFEGTGQPDSFTLNGSFELARLSDELGRFFDLGELQLVGDGQTNVTWKRQPDGTFAANADLETTNFTLARPGKPSWHDERLSVRLAASGRIDGRDIAAIETASVKVDSAADEFTASLASPVADARARKPWPIDARLRGDLGRWVARAEPWLGLPAGIDISGEADVVTKVRWSEKQIDLDKCQADFQRLRAHGGGLYLDEPRLRMTAAGAWVSDARRLELREAALTAADVSAEIEDVSVVVGDAAASERIGRGKLQGNLATLHRWFQNPHEPANWQLTGMVACTLHADLSSRSPALDVDATIDDLVAVPRDGQPWRERQVRLVASARYDEKTDIVQLANFKLTSDLAQVDATGRIERWSKDRELAVSGHTDYDLEKLSLVLQPYVAGEVRATGRESRQFSLAGPLGAAQASTAAIGAAIPANPQPAAAAAPAEGLEWTRRLSGKADFGWQTASLYGFDVGPGSLQSGLDGGVLSIAPARLSVSGGTLDLAPKVRLAPGPVELSLPPGPLVEQVQITPQMCQHWLMYVAPAVAGVTEAQGRFSVQMAGCRLPLGDLKSGDAAGQMTVHTVEIGPGPLLQELSLLLDRPTGAKLKKESKVDFRMVQGRVYHRGLELEFPEITIRTYGSVGFDQTLAIMAEMPVPPKWIRENALGNVLKGQTIQIPIAGTLHRPQIDRQAMAQVMSQFARKAAGGALRNELERQLDKLDRLIPQPK